MKSHKNKMSVFNLGVVFGPTLLRAAEETLAAILDIKFNNVVIEILIENYDLIFKNPPGKTSEYLAHSNASPPEPVPRTYGAYRSSRNSINNVQPVVRVVTRSNYTDTVMSSSLQNIPNGLAIYQNTNKNPSKNHHPIYDTKTHNLSTLNQSTPSLNRDVNHIMTTTNRELTPQQTYLTTTTPPGSNHINNQSPNHRSGGSSLSSVTLDHSISPHQTPTIPPPNQSNHTNNRNRDIATSLSPSVMTRSANDGIYVQRLNPMNYSESNLVHPMSVMDRINSTSSSNESVCSTSSLNHSYTRPTQQQPTKPLQPSPASLSNYLDYNNSSNNYTITRDDTSQSYMPKKTQRTKEIVRQRYNSPRDNV